MKWTIPVTALVKRGLRMLSLCYLSNLLNLHFGKTSICFVADLRKRMPKTNYINLYRREVGKSSLTVTVFRAGGGGGGG